MGKINDRNFQLKLAFQDDDLRKPAHDEIMLWLVEWAKHPENVRKFITFPSNRLNYERIELDAGCKVDVEQTRESQSVRRKIDAENERLHPKNQDAPWADEPPMSFDYQKGVWEPQLNVSDHNSNQRMIGYLDYKVSYKIGYSAKRTICHAKKPMFQEVEEPNPPRMYKPERKFDLVDTVSRVEFTQDEDWRTLYFEVKTEIKSIGELMRQLSLYKTSEEVKRAASRNVIGIVVVAPFHEEAVNVIRSQGYGYLEHRPAKPTLVR